MTLVFANSATVTVPERLVLRGGRWASVALKVRYGLLVHPTMGPILIDTGYGPRVTQAPGRSIALKLYARGLLPCLQPDHQPVNVLARHGFKPIDVSLIILTHFHADHISELRQFPNARFLADLSAWARIKTSSALNCVRYGYFRELVPADFEARTRNLRALPRRSSHPLLPDGYDLLGDGSLLGVDLPGHADGHFGVCLMRPPTAPLLYAVDTQWILDALDAGHAPEFPARLIMKDHGAAKTSTEMVRAFKDAGGEVVLCHDPGDSAYDLRAGPPT